MRLLPALTCCLALAAPAAARDLVVSATWDIAADARLVLALRRADGLVLTHTETDIGPGAQSATLTLTDVPRQAVTVQAALVGSGTIWAQSAVTGIDPRSDALALDLSRHLTLTRTSQHDCGETLGMATLRLQDNRLVLRKDGAALAVLPEAEGTRSWRLADGTRLRLTGTSLQLEGSSGQMTDCPGLPAPPVLPLGVFGAQGAWQMDLRPDGASVRLDPAPAEPVTHPEALPALRTAAGTILVTGPDFVLHLTDQICHLAGELVPYPFTARLEQAAPLRTAQGCAGAPAELLTGPDWKVALLLGHPVAGEMTLGFTMTEVAGRSSCNRYVAAFQIAQGRAALSDLGTTRLGCDTAALNLEQRFLNALEKVDGFEIGRDGSLILRAGVTAVLTARRK